MQGVLKLLLDISIVNHGLSNMNLEQPQSHFVQLLFFLKSKLEIPAESTFMASDLYGFVFDKLELTTSIDA